MALICKLVLLFRSGSRILERGSLPSEKKVVFSSPFSGQKSKFSFYSSNVVKICQPLSLEPDIYPGIEISTLIKMHCVLSIRGTATARQLEIWISRTWVNLSCLYCRPRSRIWNTRLSLNTRPSRLIRTRQNNCTKRWNCSNNERTNTSNDPTLRVEPLVKQSATWNEIVTTRISKWLVDYLPWTYFWILFWMRSTMYT